MNLKLQLTQLQQNHEGAVQAVEISDGDTGELAGYIVATPEGLHIVSDWLAGIVMFEQWRPRQADVFMHRAMRELPLTRSPIAIDTGKPLDNDFPRTAASGD